MIKPNLFLFNFRFCQNKIDHLNKSGNRIADKESQILMWDLMILLLRQKNRPDGSDIAELLCPFDKQSHQSFYKNQTTKHQTNAGESDNENATDMSDIEQETDEDYVKVRTIEFNSFTIVWYNID